MQTYKIQDSKASRRNLKYYIPIRLLQNPWTQKPNFASRTFWLWCWLLTMGFSHMFVNIVLQTVPWVPEPRNLDERKLVRGKERRKKGGTFFPSLFFSFYYFLALVPRLCKLTTRPVFEGFRSIFKHNFNGEEVFWTFQILSVIYGDASAPSECF